MARQKKSPCNDRERRINLPQVAARTGKAGNRNRPWLWEPQRMDGKIRAEIPPVNRLQSPRYAA